MKRFATVCALMLWAFSMRGAAGPSPTGYSIVDLGTLGGNTSTPERLNERGQVAGIAAVPAFPLWHAALWNGGPPAIDLLTLGGPTSFAYDINEEGIIVGNASTAGGSRGYVRLNGSLVVLQTLATLGPSHGYAIASRVEQVSGGTLQLNGLRIA